MVMNATHTRGAGDSAWSAAKKDNSIDDVMLKSCAPTLQVVCILMRFWYHIVFPERL